VRDAENEIGVSLTRLRSNDKDMHYSLLKSILEIVADFLGFI